MSLTLMPSLPQFEACQPNPPGGNLRWETRKTCVMESNQQPESDESKLRQRLEEVLRQARVLDGGHPRAGQSAPRHHAAPRPAFSPHPAARLHSHHALPQAGHRPHRFLQARGTGRVGRHDHRLPGELLPVAIPVHGGRRGAPARRIELHSGRYNQLLRNSDWRSQVFGYAIAREEAILRSLLQLRLLVDCVQILTPPLDDRQTHR